MGKPKAGEVRLVKKRATSLSQKKPLAKNSKATSASKKSLVKPKIVHKKIRLTPEKDDVRKIQIIQNIVKRRPLEPASRPARSLLVSRISLALLVPFRSLDNTQTMSNVARYAGTMFVVLGAFFTLYNMSNALYIANEQMSAETISSTCSSGWCPETDTVTITQTSTTDPCSSGWCTPAADIKVASSNNTLTGSVPVNVTVAKATKVYLIAYNLDTKTRQNIGAMAKNSDILWTTEWRTLNFDDGTYRLDVVIENDYAGSYGNQGSTQYLVANHPVDTSGATATTTTTASTQSNTQTTTATTSTVSGTSDIASTSTITNTTTSTTSTTKPTSSALVTDTALNGSTTTTSTTSITTAATTTPISLLASSTLPSVRVEMGMSEPLHGTVNIKTFVTGASSVRVYGRAMNSTLSNLLGYASLHALGEWRFNLNTERMQNGDYDLKVQALFPNNTSNTRTIQAVTIKNDISQVVSSSTDLSLLPPRGVSTTSPTSQLVGSDITLNLSRQNPLKNTVDIYIHVPSATYVELYARRTSGTTPRFLGLAKWQSDISWRHRFDTTELPNGTYELYAKAGISNQYEPLVGASTAIRIENEPVSAVPPNEQQYVETLRNAGTEVKSLDLDVVSSAQLRNDETDDGDDKEPISLLPSPYNEITDQFEEEHQEKLDDILSSFRKDIDRVLHEYSIALRKNDTETVRSLQNELEQIRGRAVAELPVGEEREDLVTRINESLGTIIKDLRERIERSETLIKERVGEAVTKDSDRDGISDYDEVNLYETDPFSADSDKDGFIDGVEVLNGYDPKDSTVETNVQYESPREQGVVREDLLTVDHITTIEEEEGDESMPKAYLAGKALPNSFVTLYVFSTPIVVTVKADSSGNWSYLFEKELEDGSHEVYVGITDNSGRIIAKSNPLSFVKTAEAFTPVDAEASAVVSSVRSEPSLMSQYALLIFGSLAVVSLGLVLILLGLHVRPKEEELQFA